MIPNVVTLLAASILAAASTPTASPNVPGQAIVARSGAHALILWDATPEIAEIVKIGLDDAAATSRLERDALEEVEIEEPKLSAATTIAVRIIYTKSGDVSPTYGAATFAGVERYAMLSITVADVRSDRGKWKELVAATGRLPSWVDFTVLGTLPPR